MLRAVLEARLLLATLCAAAVGVCGLRAYPFDLSDAFLAVIEARRPDIAQGLGYAYATLWFSTSFCLASLSTSLVAIVVFRRAPHKSYRSLPPYPEPEARPAPSLVLGEVHHVDRPGERRIRSGSSFLGEVSTPA